MKIGYMKDKVWRQLKFKIWRNFNSFLFVDYHFRLIKNYYAYINIRSKSRNVEYKGTFFIWYFVDPPLALIISKNLQ